MQYTSNDNTSCILPQALLQTATGVLLKSGRIYTLNNDVNGAYNSSQDICIIVLPVPSG